MATVAQQIRHGLAMIAVSAAVISFMPVAAKLAYLDGANPLAVMTARSVIGTVGLGLFLLFRGRALNFPKAAIRFGTVTGFTQAVTSGALLIAVAYIDVSLAILIVFLHTLLVAVYHHVRGTTRLSPLQFGLIVTALAGLALAIAADFSDLDPLGLVLAFFAMIAAGAMVITAFKATETIGAVRANFLMTSWASVLFIAAAFAGPATGLYAAPILPQSAIGWFGLVATGISFSLGYLLFFSGAKLVGITRASILSLSEPLITILFAMVMLGEFLTATQWLGVAMVIGSLIGVEMAPKKR